MRKDISAHDLFLGGFMIVSLTAGLIFFLNPTKSYGEGSVAPNTNNISESVISTSWGDILKLKDGNKTCYIYKNFRAGGVGCVIENQKEQR